MKHNINVIDRIPNGTREYGIAHHRIRHLDTKISPHSHARPHAYSQSTVTSSHVEIQTHMEAEPCKHFSIAWIVSLVIFRDVWSIARCFVCHCCTLFKHSKAD